MRINYYSYESYTFSCKNCGWTGIGKDVDFGEQYPECFEVLCPKCKEWFDEVVSFPTYDEAIEQGPAIDKLTATAAKSYREKWLTSKLKDISQLPDLNDDLMAFVVREIDEDNEKYIVVSYMGKDIWRELVGYEYYDQFINLGKKFKKKYGDKMIDFVPDVGDYYIYGDKFKSIGLVKDFRENLRTNNSCHL